MFVGQPQRFGSRSSGETATGPGDTVNLPSEGPAQALVPLEALHPQRPRRPPAGREGTPEQGSFQGARGAGEVALGLRGMDRRSLHTSSKAGFWARAAAALLDGLLVYALCRIAGAVSLSMHVYVPFEATYLALAAAYSVLGIAWRGATMGKAVCGLKVCTVAGRRVPFTRAGLRETGGKLLSAIPLCAGFLAAAGCSKRSWHDRMVGTAVYRVREGSRSRFAVASGLGVGSLILGLWVAGLAQLSLSVLPVMPRGQEALRRAERETAPSTEVSLVGEADEAEYASWLEEHGMPPADFLVAKCRRYPVVIVGEKHWERESLTFLCDVLPELHRSGVRCIAMEWLLAEDGELIERLVTAEIYDRQLALEIARHHSWRTWGWKEYVDVLEVAWRLNAAMAPEDAKLRVVGLDLPIDLPSMALAGFGDEAVAGPAWERLRLIRMVRELPKAAMRDAFMARQVEQQVLERGERAIVWVGAAHSTVGCRGPGDTAGWGRMGFLLARKHSGSIHQIYLHDVFGRGPGGSGTESGISDFVERLMERRGNAPLGFDVLGSPFETLRDSQHWSFGRVGGRSFGDLACSYLFLAPRSRLRRCDWLAGYVTDRMLAENRPLYEAVGRHTGIEVRDAPSANRALSRQ